MPKVRKIPQVTPTLPELPGPSEATDLVRARIVEKRQHEHNAGISQVDTRIHEAYLRLPRRIDGENGWAASLMADTNGAAGYITNLYLVSDLLAPLADWWEETVTPAVNKCPPPEGVILPAFGGVNVDRIKEEYDRWDIFIFDNEDLGNLHVGMAMEFNGRAKQGDIIWPVDPAQLMEVMTNRLQAALGIQKMTILGRTRTARPWSAAEVHGRKNWGKARIFEDFSGSTANERGVLVKQPPAPLKPTGVWSNTKQWIGQGICNGESCDYGPGPNPGRATNVSGCDAKWKEYAESLLQLFMDANPDVQFGPKSECPSWIATERHRCSWNNDKCTRRGNPLDHDQRARLPDGRRLIITQPYCPGIPECEDCTKTLREWQKKDPLIAVRTGGEERSWYFPTYTNLMLVGHAETLDAINLDYPMSEKAIPTGCQTWVHNRGQDSRSI